jgi:protein ImuB
VASAGKERPVWLLSDPDPVRRDRYRLLRGPERIESGWWDGAGVQRDYYRAVDAKGAHLWIYRECTGARKWFLQGIFG